MLILITELSQSNLDTIILYVTRFSNFNYDIVIDLKCVNIIYMSKCDDYQEG